MVDLDSTLAIAAAQLSHAHRLPMAGSIILVTARSHQARLHTTNPDFRGLGDDVELIAKQRMASRSGAIHGPFREVSLAHCLSAGCGIAFAWALLPENPRFFSYNQP